jgi:phosphoenolpyruvate synthase/pyruvate phosphate dikinase
MQDDLPPEVRAEIDTLLAQVAAGEDPYLLATTVSGAVHDALAESKLAGELFMLFLSLEDLFELWPDKRDEAQELIRRAAAGWGSLRDDRALDAYFEGYAQQITKTVRAWGPSPVLAKLRHAIASSSETRPDEAERTRLFRL